jgi:citrate lyase beta subunit
LVLDLEDGVAINQKENARKTVLNSLKIMKFGRAEKSIRINAIGSGLENEDFEKCVKFAASEGLIDAIVIPKVESGSHLNYVSKFLDSCGSAAKNVKLLAAIESAKGLVDLR